MEIVYVFSSNSNSGAAAGSGNYLFPLPTGYSIDTGSFTVGAASAGGSGNSIAGTGYAHHLGGAGETGQVIAFAHNSTNFYLRVGPSVTDGGGDDGYTNNTVSSTTFHMNEADGIRYSFKVSVPIRGWNTNFNPLLSMPLVDFGSYSNIYSGKITNGGTAAIASQSETFISSVSRGSAGVTTINFVSGHFTQVPAIAVAGDTNSTTNELIVSVDALSATAATIRTSLDNGVETDGDYWITLIRQGSDHKPLPQPTAAVIKPAVAYVKDVKAYNADGGVSGTGDTWHARTLNTIQGESWFINSLSSNIVTLQAGTYEVEGIAPFSRVDGNIMSLYDTTNTIRLAWSECQTSPDGKNHNPHVKWVGTFTAATGVRLEFMVDTASTDAHALGFPPSSISGTGITSADRAVYAQLKITKLK